MNGTIKKVFGVIALLVLVFLLWQIFFNEGGILTTAYNAFAKTINNQYEKVAGEDGDQLLPYWGETSADTNGDGSMETEGE